MVSGGFNVLGGNRVKFSIILVCVVFVKKIAGEMYGLYVMAVTLAGIYEVFCVSCMRYSANNVFRHQS